jgi:hypothetical protein
MYLSFYSSMDMLYLQEKQGLLLNRLHSTTIGSTSMKNRGFFSTISLHPKEGYRERKGIWRIM